jgi:uridine kinase
MFDQLVLPLQHNRSHRGKALLADATNASAYREWVYEFTDVAIVLLEGIFLLKQAFRNYYDLALWVDCTFETALERALGRGQEGLSPEDAIRDYETIYFAAQRLHIARDHPRETANLVIPNDPRLEGAEKAQREPW